MTSRVVRNKELKSLYGGFGGYVIAAAVILAVGIAVIVKNFNGGDNRIEYTLESLLPIYAVLIPLITMRSFAGEISSGTIAYIDAVPGAGKGFVFGKFQALLLAFTAPFIAVCMVPAIFSLYGDVNLISSYAGILAFWLAGVCLLSVGMLISAYTDSPWTAGAMTFCLIAIDYLLPSAASHLPTQIIPAIVKNLSIFYQYRYFAVGYPDLRTLIVYAAVTVCCLLLMIHRMEVRRYMNR